MTKREKKDSAAKAARDARRRAADKPVASEGVRRWEYQIVQHSLNNSPLQPLDKACFDAIGAQGWELVSVAGGSACFKRPIVAGLAELLADLGNPPKPVREHDTAGGICWCSGMWDDHKGKPDGPHTKRVTETELPKPGSPHPVLDKFAMSEQDLAIAIQTGLDAGLARMVAREILTLMGRR